MKNNFFKGLTVSLACAMTVGASAAVFSACGTVKTVNYGGTWTLLGGPAALQDLGITTAGVSETLAIFDDGSGTAGSYILVSGYVVDEWSTGLDETVYNLNPAGSYLNMGTPVYQTYYGEYTSEYDDILEQNTVTISTVTRVVGSNYDSDNSTYSNASAATQSEVETKAELLVGTKYELVEDGSMDTDSYLQERYLSTTAQEHDWDYTETKYMNADGTAELVGVTQSISGPGAACRWLSNPYGYNNYVMATSDTLVVFDDGSYEYAVNYTWDYTTDSTGLTGWYPLAFATWIYKGTATVAESKTTVTIDGVATQGRYDDTGAYGTTDVDDTTSFPAYLKGTTITLKSDGEMSGAFALQVNSDKSIGLYLFYTVYADCYGGYPGI